MNDNVNNSTTESRSPGSVFEVSLSENDVRESGRILASLHTSPPCREISQSAFLQSAHWVHADYIASFRLWVYLPGPSNKVWSFQINFNQIHLSFFTIYWPSNPKQITQPYEHAGQWFNENGKHEENLVDYSTQRANHKPHAPTPWKRGLWPTATSHLQKSSTLRWNSYPYDTLFVIGLNDPEGTLEVWPRNVPK